MNLIVKTVQTPLGGQLHLCSEDGEFLPCIRTINFHHEAGQAPLITVTFVVDGKKIRIAD